MSLVDSIELGALRGRKKAEIVAEYVGEVTEGDLELLLVERGTAAPTIKKLGDRHHALARCLAQSMSHTEASLVTGYDVSRVSILSKDPLFKQLVEDYRKVEDGLMAEFTQRAAVLSLTAMNNLQELLEAETEDGTPALSPALTLEVAKFGADRTGNGPMTKAAQLNINVDLGSRLAAARKREATTQANLLTQANGTGEILDAEFSPAMVGGRTKDSQE